MSLKIDKSMNYPIVTEVDYQDPLCIFALFAEREGAIFLDSAKCQAQVGRYSFIAIDPFQIIKSKNGIVYKDQKKYEMCPFTYLEKELAQFKLLLHPNLPPFQGGVAGFFSYDLLHQLEDISVSNSDDMQFPDLILGFYDLVLAFDLELKKAWIFSSGFPELQQELRYERATQRIQWLLSQLTHVKQVDRLTQPFCSLDKITTNFTPLQYEDSVAKVKDYILAGDIFEANISQRFLAQMSENINTLHLYHVLRQINPAPFAAFLCFEECTLVSASPERFLKLSQKQVQARPIKGTCARSLNDEEDLRLAHELMHSSKDRAENIMIVDLLRNDLSKVSLDHSVKVPILCGLESYATVHHLVSIVQSELKPDKTAIDLLRATFPGGSITGAPKIRAMEIIAEIEPNFRGPYCGSVGYIGFNGDMDTSITIRTFVIKNNIITFQAGGAVVADSNPKLEYAETLVKAQALIKALTQVID